MGGPSPNKDPRAGKAARLGSVQGTSPRVSPGPELEGAKGGMGERKSRTEAAGKGIGLDGALSSGQGGLRTVGKVRGSGASL